MCFYDKNRFYFVFLVLFCFLKTALRLNTRRWVINNTAKRTVFSAPLREKNNINGHGVLKSVNG